MLVGAVVTVGRWARGEARLVRVMARTKASVMSDGSTRHELRRRRGGLRPRLEAPFFRIAVDVAFSLILDDVAVDAFVLLLPVVLKAARPAQTPGRPDRGAERGVPRERGHRQAQPRTEASAHVEQHDDLRLRASKVTRSLIQASKNVKNREEYRKDPVSPHS